MFPFVNLNLESCDSSLDTKGDKAALRLAVQSVLNSKYGMLFTVHITAYSYNFKGSKFCRWLKS